MSSKVVLEVLLDVPEVLLDHLTDRLTEYTPLDGGPTYPIFRAMKATILGHILAPFWVHLGVVWGALRRFSGHLGPPEIRPKIRLLTPFGECREPAPTLPLGECGASI